MRIGDLVDPHHGCSRAVKEAKASGDSVEIKVARAGVQTEKVALGERGPVWWWDGAPDLVRHAVEDTLYAEWNESLGGAGSQSK